MFMDEEVLSSNTELTASQEVINKLFDKKNIEMITFLNDSEIEDISKLKAITKEENKVRDKLNINEKSIFLSFINEMLLLRTSRQGWRSEQGVKILNNYTDEENKNTNILNNLKSAFK